MSRHPDKAPIPVRMPTLFVPHGAGPCFFMEWDPADAWDKMAAFLKGIAATLPQRPRAIVLVSGHWLERQVMVTAGAAPELIYDYHGFPAHTYALRYPVPGDPALATRLVELLGQAAIAAAGDPRRGYDHGVFIPLKLMFPDADVPVVQLSLRSDLDAKAHLQIGRAIAPLRDEGVLIVGSGMSFHNMRGYGNSRFGPISDEFDQGLSNAVAAPPAQRDTLLRQWADLPSARLCHPPGAEEHLLPLMVAAGSAVDSPGRKIFSDRVMQTTLSAYQFG
jgi:aromatic ring-opening dioxygenase catalytic subunit (LigB family)